MNLDDYELIDAKQMRDGDLVLRKKEEMPVFARDEKIGCLSIPSGDYSYAMVRD